METRSRLFSLFVALLLLLTQSVAVVHASEHPFHADEEFCESLIAVEKQAASGDIASNGIVVTAIEETGIESLEQSVFSTVVSNYRSRAPPSV